MVHDINLPNGDIEAYNIFVDAFAANAENNDFVQRFVVDLAHVNYQARDGKPVCRHYTALHWAGILL